ncbi:hypothetical protein HU200_061650 [Digitaria exilis]|uniref:O-methyltransferase C-terminal domain-containing protein n=1 Tax=Digitaria exilis TaxID=1010633 RepID=A0A835AEL1_9POAL|nr:hypothetical protein HU200_061650 [Digitaria exilis]
MTPWMMTKNDDVYNEMLNETCAADSNFAMDTVLKDAGVAKIFSGLGSLVDVGGGHGAEAVAIARAFPHIQCKVLDLEQVVSKAPADGTGTVQFVSGDMFESVPPADAVLLKSSVKILRQCRRAIPARDAGGKVIVMNMVVGYGTPDRIAKEAQEHEWKRIFLEAGFSDYKITPTLGFQSIIEVFP